MSSAGPASCCPGCVRATSPCSTTSTWTGPPRRRWSTPASPRSSMPPPCSRGASPISAPRCWPRPGSSSSTTSRGPSGSPTAPRSESTTRSCSPTARRSRWAARSTSTPWTWRWTRPGPGWAASSSPSPTTAPSSCAVRRGCCSTGSACPSRPPGSRADLWSSSCRAAGAARSLASIEAFIREQDPVLVGVDRGADLLLDSGHRPDIVLLSNSRRRRRTTLGQGAADRPRRGRPGRQRREAPRRAARAARRPPVAAGVLRHQRGHRAAAAGGRGGPADRRGGPARRASRRSWTARTPASPAPTSPGSRSDTCSSTRRPYTCSTPAGSGRATCSWCWSPACSRWRRPSP